MAAKRAFLLVEDNEDDIFLIKRALKEAQIQNPLYVVEDGQQAKDYLAGNGQFMNRTEYPLPALLFLDLRLPVFSGHEVLAWIRQQEHLKSLIVVVLTCSDEPSDVSKSYKLGANSYLVKPATPDQFLDLAKAFKWDWLDYEQFAMA